MFENKKKLKISKINPVFLALTVLNFPLHNYFYLSLHILLHLDKFK